MSATAIRSQMKALASPARAAVVEGYFKTGPGDYGAGDRFLGIRVPVLRKLAREHERLPLGDVSSLLKSPWHEERLVALLILVRRHARGRPSEREAIHRLYLRNSARINSWDLVDLSAEQIVGAHLAGRSREILVRLAKSTRLWERRIAVLATFHEIKQGRYDETLRIASLLLDDPHDLIHKAVGWMLREVGNRDRAVEEMFLRKYAGRMPRTMLRYAIERFPERLRQRYLSTARE